MSLSEFYQDRQRFFISLPPLARGGLSLAVLLGILAFISGVMLGEYQRSWGAFLFNLMFFFSLALGGVAFGGMQDIIGATWGRPIKRLHEAFGSFLPWCFGFFILFWISIKFKLLGADQVYNWVADPHVLHGFHGKDIWLQLDFMLIRDFFALVSIMALASWHLKMTIKRDMSLLNGQEKTAVEEGKQAEAKLRYWSAPILCAHAMSFSLICFDLTMSLAPTWFSTLWGAWSFAIMMHSLMAALLLLMFYLKKTAIGTYIDRQQFHDIGKLMFGFTVFFAYLTFAHVLTYWYGNVPEETSYFITRLQSPWLNLVIAIPFIGFLLPFLVLIPKASKWTPSITIPISMVVLLSQWITYYLVVMPELVEGGQAYFPWIELGLSLGFMGLFIFSVFAFGKRVPMLSVADPLFTKYRTEGHH